MGSRPLTGSFASDVPITSASGDRLGRLSFANAVATAIADWSADTSLVVAIYGPWGSGKTSTKNLIIEALVNKGAAIDVVEFNPWQFADEGTLYRAFFREIELALLGTDASEKGAATAARWKSWAAAVALSHTAASIAASTIRHSLWIAAVVLGFSGISLLLSIARHPVATAVVAAVYLVIAAVAGLLAVSQDVTKKIAAWLEARHATSIRSLAAQKEELAFLLMERPRPLLIAIDDIDRLVRDDIRRLIRLVKAHADMPKLVYLLLCQREVVEKALSEGESDLSGRQFVEKIVQAPFDLPRADREQISKVFSDDLDRLLADVEISRTFREQRWQEIFDAGVWPFLTSLRSINRYMASLRFHIGLLKETGVLEVNIIDLIGVEVLRVFEPDVYRRLPLLKTVLTRRHEKKGVFPVDESAAKAAVEDLVGQASADHREPVKRLISELFPFTEWIFGGSKHLAGEDDWLRDLRVTEEDMFDRYFQLAIPSGQLSEARFRRVIDSVPDRRALVSQLTEFHGEGTLDAVLERLDAFKTKLDVLHAQSLVTALFDIGELFPTGRRVTFAFSQEMRGCRIILGVLRREPRISQRLEVLHQGTTDSVGLFMPVRYLSLELEAHDEGNTGAQLVPSIDQLDELKKICAVQIRRWASDGRLWASPHRQYILHRWVAWGYRSEAKSWVEQETRDDKRLLTFLKQYPIPSAEGEAPLAHRQWKLSLDALVDVVDLETVENRLGRLEPTLSGGDGDAGLVKNYLEALEWRRKISSDQSRPVEANSQLD